MKVPRSLFLLSAVATIALCGQARACAPASPEQIEAVRAAMETQLFDAQSARFQNVCVVQGRGQIRCPHALCGLVNGKNRYGAYVGYVRFSYVAGAAKATILQESARPDQLSLSLYCQACTPDEQCFPQNRRR